MDLGNLLNEIRGKLPSNDVNIIVELIDKQEWGIAYEIICSQLYEHEVLITKEFYEKIVSYGKSIKMKPSIWLPLEELIQKTFGKESIKDSMQTLRQAAPLLGKMLAVIFKIVIKN